MLKKSMHSKSGPTLAGEQELAQRVLVLAPFGRDAVELSRELGQAGIEAERCGTIAQLCAEVDRGAAAALVAEEALLDADRRRLSATLTAQPAWSDFPVLVMMSRGKGVRGGWNALRGIDGTGHLTLLERPLHIAALLSAVRTALDARRRQYQVRDELIARKHAQELLSRQRQLLEGIIDSIPVMLVIWDANLQVFSLNRHAETVLGWTTADANDGDFMERVYPEPERRAEVRDFMQSLTPGWREFEVTTKDGKLVPSEWANIRLDDDTMIGIGIDLRDRKAAEEELRRSDARYRTLFESIDEGFCIIEMIFDRDAKPIDYRFLETSPSFERQTGLTNAKGKRGRELMPGQEDYWSEIYGRVAATGEPVRFENRSNQLNRWYDVYAFRLGRPEERQVAILFNDITERKRAEEDLRRLNESLEAQVSERTHMAERRARHLRQLAAELSDAEHRERVRLARLLHDDLQQLLMAIKMRLPILAKAPRSDFERQIAEIDELVKASLHSSRDLTRELSPPILQYGTLGEAIEWLADWFGEKHALTVHLEADKVPRTPEHLRVFLFQAVRELLLNVVKHSGTLEARVATSSRVGHLVIQVEDDGAGFDPSTVEKRLQRPSGFGLFNLQERLEALGGRLEIRNSSSGGACFRMIVPVAKATESTGEHSETRVAEAAPATTAGRTSDRAIRLLVVDDHHIVREGFAAMLDRQSDFEVVGEAADGRQAIEQAEVLQPDAIIMDVEMPHLNGIEATRQIKARWPDTVIVGLSLHDDAAIRRIMTEAGAAEHINKRAPGKDLIESLRRACRRERSAEGPQES